MNQLISHLSKVKKMKKMSLLLGMLSIMAIVSCKKKEETPPPPPPTTETTIEVNAPAVEEKKNYGISTTAGKKGVVVRNRKSTRLNSNQLQLSCIPVPDFNKK